MPASTVQPLVVDQLPHYELRTPFIPGLPLGPPTGRNLYRTSTPRIIEGLDHTVPQYTLNTPVIPGVELDGTTPGGIDDLDETYGRTTLWVDYTAHLDEILETAISLDNRDWVADMDETYEPSSFRVLYLTNVAMTPVLADEPQVQALSAIQIPGEDQVVILTPVL